MAYKVRGSKWNYNPKSSKAHRLSRSKIDLFHECPRCFYLDQVHGIARPRMASFTLNLAVDTLLKKEFDTYRKKQQPHPLMTKAGIDAIPYSHKDLDTWRENFEGVSHIHKPTNFEVFGAIDDVWINPEGQLHVVDYKATSKLEEPTLEGRWGEGYKRQMEVYQWLLRQNGFDVSDTGYFVYANGDASKDAFNEKLEFDMKIIPYTGNTAWIEKLLPEIQKVITSDTVPPSGELCEFCPYRTAAGNLLLKKFHEGKVT